MLAVPFTASCSFCYMSKPPATLEAKIYPTFTIPKPKSFERRNSIKLYLYGSASKKSNFELFLLQSTNGKELDDMFCWNTTSSICVNFFSKSSNACNSMCYFLNDFKIDHKNAQTTPAKVVSKRKGGYRRNCKDKCVGFFAPEILCVWPYISS